MTDSRALRFGLFHAGILSTIGFVCLSVQAQEFPKGWHTPAANLTRQKFRQGERNHFLVAVGDYNGDGVPDKAFLLVNDASSELGLFVCLKTSNGCDWRRLEEMDVGFLDVMGIATVKSGRYQTACGKGYWECDEDEPSILILKHAAIEFFKEDSASSYYVYDRQKNDFTAIAISD
jgi:hypothetical protein